MKIDVQFSLSLSLSLSLSGGLVPSKNYQNCLPLHQDRNKQIPIIGIYQTSMGQKKYHMHARGLMINQGLVDDPNTTFWCLGGIWGKFQWIWSLRLESRELLL